tara:strand:+ start:3452 stop:4084 length:633 start_codon:yes stop_codon:yes gene_type:complete
MPKSIYKSTNSLQNIILLLLFVVGLFVLYRYVKTIETETKLLQNHLIELTEKIQFLLNNTNNSQSAPKLTSPKLPHTEYVDVVIDDDKLNDTMSIQSEDITNMLRKVMGGGNDEDVDEDIIANMMVDVNGDEVENNVKIEEIVEDDDYEKEKEKEEEEDAIIISNTNTDEVTLKSLSKKTNEELKTMLKEKSLLTKGTKSELVERLLSNM